MGVRGTETKGVESRRAWVYLILVTVAHTLNHVFVQIVPALLPVFNEEFNLDLFTLSLIPTIPLISQALMSVPFGILSDRFEHRRLIAVSLALCGGAALLVSQAQSIHIVIISFSLLALSSTLFHPPAYSITSEIFKVHRRSTALGIHGAGGTLGISLGPISAGIIMAALGKNSWRLTYLMWAVPSLLFTVLVMSLKVKSAEGNPTEKAEAVAESVSSMRSVLTMGFILFLLTMGIRSFGAQAVSTWMTSYLTRERGFPVEIASLLFGAMPLMGLAAAPVGGILADRVGERKWLTIAYAGETLVLVGIAFSPSTLTLIPFILLYGFFNFTGMGASSALVARFTPRSRRGIAYALYFMPFSLVGSASPVASGFVVGTWGYWYIFPFATIVYAFTILLLQLIPIRKEKA